MALTDSNTFSLPSQGSSIAVSRTQFNSSLRSLLQNFYSDAIPASDNLLDGGSSLGATEYDGMLYRASDTGVLYVSDSSIDSARTTHPVGGNFTRYGIAWRQQHTPAAAALNIADFDIGEAFAIVKDTGGSSNNSIWLRVNDTGTYSSDFIDLRVPQDDQVTTAKIRDGNITGPKLQTGSMVAITTTQMEYTNSQGLTITPRLIVNTFANNQTSNTAAAVELKTTGLANDVALGFNNTGKSATLKMIAGDTGDTDRGLGVYTTDAALAPIRANLVVQSTIMGSTSETAAPLIPAGVIVAWGGSSAPAGWLECNGQSTSGYTALAAVVGATVPDIRGRAIYGTSTSIARLATSTAIGASFNTSAYNTASGGGHTHTVTTASTNSTTDKDVTGAINAVTAIAAASDHVHSITTNYPGISLMYIIKT